MNTELLLGPVLFADFEVPERISFGGSQRLAIHSLPGGGRVIDALGRDDADITWSGIFTGPDAANRARLLDTLRAEGAALPLTWDAFCYAVVIARFAADYAHPNWVPYRLTCTVLRDEAASPPTTMPNLAASLAADLATAATNTSAATTALAVAGATSRGTPAYAAATIALATTTATLRATIAANETTLTAASPTTAPGLTTAYNTAGTIAAATLSLGYISRAGKNLANAGT
jgi:hypothetical protein